MRSKRSTWKTLAEDLLTLIEALSEDECSVRAVANRVRYIGSFLSHFKLTLPEGEMTFRNTRENSSAPGWQVAALLNSAFAEKLIRV